MIEEESKLYDSANPLIEAVMRSKRLNDSTFPKLGERPQFSGSYLSYINELGVSASPNNSSSRAGGTNITNYNIIDSSKSKAWSREQQEMLKKSKARGVEITSGPKFSGGGRR